MAELPAREPAAGRPSEARDRQSDDWLRDLRGDGHLHEDAVARLHALLLRGARYTIARHRTLLPQFSELDLEQIALESADDATVAILSRLDDFRGESRFTTWAYKFAFLDATAKLRQRAWRGREIPTEPESWTILGATADADQAELAELLAAIGDGLAEALTERQRDVLVAVAINGVAIEVVAERLGTTRGALYKTMHDARVRLRAYLAERGLGPLENGCWNARTFARRCADCSGPPGLISTATRASRSSTGTLSSSSRAQMRIGQSR